jgi:WD40 repeat protein
LAFSPDGNLLASGGKDMAVNIWDAATGQLLKHLSEFDGEVEPLAFSADGKVLATGDWAGVIQFWDVATGTKLPSPPEHGLGRRIMSIAFSPDGRYFAASAGGAYNGGLGGVALWRIEGGGTNLEARARTVFQRVPGPASAGAGCVAFSPDSQLLAWADCDTSVHLWDLKEGQERPFSAHAAGSYKCLAFQRGGNQVFFVAETGVAEAWDITTGRKAFPFADLQSQGGTDGARLDCIIALNSESACLAAISGRNVTIWDTATKKLSLTLPEEQGVIYSLAWCPNQERLAVGMGDGGLAIWDLAKVKAQLDMIGLGW